MTSDSQKIIEYDKPLVLSGPGGVQVRVTAIDANHVSNAAPAKRHQPPLVAPSPDRPPFPPLAVPRVRNVSLDQAYLQPAAHAADSGLPATCRFLIESVAPSAPVAVLVTADVRSEPRHITFLSHHPSLAPYVIQAGRANPLRRLSRVYLDTSSVLSTAELLPKQEAIGHFLRLARRYPPATRFFLNAWTWGYEDLLKAVYDRFGAKVHLDGYKRRLYGSEAVGRLDPVLGGLGTGVEGGTRWHACERRMKCGECWGEGKGCFEVGEEGERKWLKGKKAGDAEVVYVNPVEVGRARWDVYKEDLDRKIKAGEPLPNYLVRAQLILFPLYDLFTA